MYEESTDLMSTNVENEQRSLFEASHIQGKNQHSLPTTPNLELNNSQTLMSNGSQLQNQFYSNQMLPLNTPESTNKSKQKNNNTNRPHKCSICSKSFVSFFTTNIILDFLDF